RGTTRPLPRECESHQSQQAERTGSRGGMSQAPEAWPNLSSVYHGLQQLELCAFHAINNGLSLATAVSRWDRRRPLSQLALPKVLISPVSLGLLSLPLRCWHWVALCQVDGIYYNLDSKLRAPEALGDKDGVRPFLVAALVQGLCKVLLVVVTKEVEVAYCWLHTS
ncbi:josephin-2 isoform X2, partial [Sigmodon hispidus]